MGKVLAKAGIFVLLLKLYKVLALGFIAILLGINKLFRRITLTYKDN